MAEVLSILGGIYTSATILDHLATHTQKWRLLSDRLFDIKEGLDAAELSLDAWKTKFDFQERRPVVYMTVLFGRLGWERIQATLGSIKIITRSIQTDVHKAVGRALAAKPGRALGYTSDRYDKELVEECLRRIKRNTSWSRKFNYSVLGKADDMEMRLDRLHRKLTALERFSELYLEKEHPDIFREIRRLPGRRVILKIADPAHDTVKSKVLDALSARKDADLLHRASQSDSSVHIGLSTPQIHKRDFAFLLSLGGHLQEVLAHPIRIKAINDRNRVQATMDKAVPALIRSSKEATYMLPSSGTSSGFQLSVPPSNLLLELAYKDPLSTLVRAQNNFLGQQVLYPQDQIALAAGIAQGAFRLIGSQWLQCLDNKNIRWRRTAEGNWTTMMAAMPGDSSTTRTLDQVLNASLSARGNKDLAKHVHIFRIGLVLTELALKTPISYIDFDPSTGGVRIFISSFNHDSEPLDATEIAAEVDNKTNILLGNIVFTCLSALEKDGMKDREIESTYYKEVLSQADQLEALVKKERKRGSPAGSAGIVQKRFLVRKK
ncbi:hypothetical protein BDV96DRAFT_1551 [Lophiotrema nucula]|uniref:Prion-inhibition and propagation-domain-containing protein n=1 Tax=Lophiotrema nucula TaxID=690887 RepID=A0A6A5ZS53_9PLEO|nr:hypothetical protein BDV96DRAFT_1551 [Lophiotrema nucula]